MTVSADDPTEKHEHAHDHDAEHGSHSHTDHHDGEHGSGIGSFVASLWPGHHHHDSVERVDRALETSRQGIRAVRISLLLLGITAAVQMVVVSVSGSVALLGDTLHNMGDALTAVPLWIAFSLSDRRATRRYTYGYGRAEDLAGIFIVLVIAISAAIAGYETVDRLIDPRAVRNVGWVMAAGVIGFIGNELVALYRIRVGRAIGSAALVADGMHARTDGLTSLAVLAGAIGVSLGHPLADPIAGLVITLALLMILRSAARDVYYRLMDAVDPALIDQVEIVLGEVPGVEEVGEVRVRWIGHRLRAEVDVTVDSALSVVNAHDIAEDAHHALLHRVPRLTSAIVHANPTGEEGRDHHAAIAHHFDLDR